MSLLEQSKGQLIDAITISLNAEALNENLHGILNDLIKSSSDNRSNLFFRIKDSELNRSLKLSSGVKIPISRHLIATLEDMELDFEINQA